MPDQITDGRTTVWWVPAIATATNPTTSEIAAGINLSCLITADGLVGFEPETAPIDTARLASRWRTAMPGRASWTGTMLRLKKQAQVGDTVYDTLTWGARGYIVVRRDLPVATAFIGAQPVEVYAVACGEVRNLPPEANTLQRYEVPLFMRRSGITGTVTGPSEPPPIPDQPPTGTESDFAVGNDETVEVFRPDGETPGDATINVTDYGWASDWDTSLDIDDEEVGAGGETEDVDAGASTEFNETDSGTGVDSATVDNSASFNETETGTAVDSATVAVDNNNVIDVADPAVGNDDWLEVDPATTGPPTEFIGAPTVVSYTGTVAGGGPNTNTGALISLTDFSDTSYINGAVTFSPFTNSYFGEVVAVVEFTPLFDHGGRGVASFIVHARASTPGAADTVDFTVVLGLTDPPTSPTLTGALPGGQVATDVDSPTFTHPTAGSWPASEFDNLRVQVRVIRDSASTDPGPRLYEIYGATVTYA